MAVRKNIGFPKPRQGKKGGLTVYWRIGEKPKGSMIATDTYETGVNYPPFQYVEAEASRGDLGLIAFGAYNAYGMIGPEMGGVALVDKKKREVIGTVTIPYNRWARLQKLQDIYASKDWVQAAQLAGFGMRYMPNPKRPTKSFMKRCVPGVGPGYDAGAVCASTWRKMSPAAKKKWLAKENPEAIRPLDAEEEEWEREARAEKAWEAQDEAAWEREIDKENPGAFPRVGDRFTVKYGFTIESRSGKAKGRVRPGDTGVIEKFVAPIGAQGQWLAKVRLDKGLRTDMDWTQVELQRRNPTFHEASEIEFIETKYPGPNYQNLLEAGYKHVSTSNGYAKMVPPPSHVSLGMKNPRSMKDKLIYGTKLAMRLTKDANAKFGTPEEMDMVWAWADGLTQKMVEDAGTRGSLQDLLNYDPDKMEQLVESEIATMERLSKKNPGIDSVGSAYRAGDPSRRPSELRKARRWYKCPNCGRKSPEPGVCYKCTIKKNPGLYEDLKAAGIPMDSHESDLYFLVTPKSLEILNKYPTQKGNSNRFRNQRDGKIWMDVPFSFDPFWAKKIASGKARKNPGDPAQADIEKIKGFKPEMLKHPDFMPALRKYIEFHGCMPESLTKVDINLGAAAKGETTFLAHMGKAPEVSYQTTNPKSNKAGSRWIHEFCEDMKKKDITEKDLPDLACTADGKAIITVGGRFEVKDWVRK